MKIGQTSFIVFLSRIASSVIGFFATVYIARELGAEVYGFYALTIALLAWLKFGGTIGGGKALTKRISEGDDPSQFASATLISVAFFGIILIMLVLTFSDDINQYVGALVSHYLVGLLVLGLAWHILISILQGERRVHIYGFLDPVNIGTKSIAQIILVSLGVGLSGLLIGYGLGLIVAIVVGVVFVSAGLARPKFHHFRSLYDYAKYSWLGAIKWRSFNDVDLLVLGAFVSSNLVGVYAITWSLSRFLDLFGSAIRSTLFPEISYADTEAKDGKVATLATDSLRYGGLILIPGLVGGAILADRLLRIYGTEFEQGTTVLILLIIATLLYSYTSQILNTINAVDRPDIAFRINAVFIAVNAVGNVVLVILLGWIGAAIATAFSAAVGLLLSFVSLRRLLSFQIPIKEIGQQILSALCMGIVVWSSRAIIEMTGITQHNVAIVLFLVTSGAGVYFLTLFIISIPFRRTVDRNIPLNFRT